MAVRQQKRIQTRYLHIKDLHLTHIHHHVSVVTHVSGTHQVQRPPTCMSAAPSCTEGCKQCNTAHKRPSVRLSGAPICNARQHSTVQAATTDRKSFVGFFLCSLLPSSSLLNGFVCEAMQVSVGHILLGTEQRWHKGRAPASFNQDD